MNTKSKFIDIKTEGNIPNTWNEVQRVIDVTSDRTERLTLVNLHFLTRIIELLPTTSDLSQFKINLKKKITNSKSLEDIIEACVDFSSFHNTINLIKEYKKDIDEDKILDGEEMLPDIKPVQKKPSIEDLRF